jgi:dihydroxyacetone kinase
MKKIQNRIEDIVLEMCRGITLAHPGIGLNSDYKFLYKKNKNRDKVTLISGGGSGHEPAHAGFIGEGMLDVAVCGDIFASPTQIQVYKAIREAAGDKGTLLIIKNYSGDIMNFSNAAYLAGMDGLEVATVKVDDDIAVEDSLYTVGRRGVAGTLFVHKVAGAAAEKGLALDEVQKLAQKAADNVRSIGFALTSCTVPAKGTPTFELSDGEIEYGVGIHGEPGIRRESHTRADELIGKMVGAVSSDLSLEENDEVALLVNGFGATPLAELYIACHAAVEKLTDARIRVYRIFVGEYMTSLDMAGASVSILKLDEELKELLDAPSTAPAFPVSGPVPAPVYEPIAKRPETGETAFVVETPSKFAKIEGEKLTLENMAYIVDVMSAVIIENEIPFCNLDSHAGDGDFGMSVAKGFRQLKRGWSSLFGQSEDAGSFLEAASEVIMEHCGGASGPIWGIAFKSAGKAVGGKKTLDIADVTSLLQAAVEGIQEIGERSFGRGAVVGDKTLIDALIPCADAWAEAAKAGRSLKDAFRLGAEAAVQGAKATEDIVARMGRAGTVGERSLGHPDAGAHALGVIFTAIADAVE